MSGSLLHAMARQYGSRRTPMERRRFVKQMLGAGAAATLTGLQCRAANLARQRVIIIGAGFAGLSCGYELTQAGFDVTILEAKPRVGGRVFSSNAQNQTEFIPGKNIEFGAELIGSNHPRWMHYAERFQLELLDVTDDPEAQLCACLMGKRLDADSVGRLWEEIGEALEAINTLARGIDVDAPWNSPNAEDLDQRTVAGFIQELPSPSIVKHALNVSFMADNGQATDQQSLLGFLTQVRGGGVEDFWIETEVYRCLGGNDRLATALAEGIGRGNLRLGASATEIHCDDNSVRVRLANGQQIEGDRIVLSSAPSVWDRIRIYPELPVWLKPQMGWNTKYFARVKDRFWRKQNPPFSQYGISDGPIQLTWEGTDNQQPEALDVPAVLVGFSGGPECQGLSAMTESERNEAFCAELEKLFPGFQNGFERSTFMNWPTEPWTRASYSFPAPGQVTSLGPHLVAPHHNGRLFLAGEHTCYPFVGYMEGALQSGHRAAQQIITQSIG